MKRNLELEPKYADQFSQVWLWYEWPDRDGHVDTGIDVVARDCYAAKDDAWGYCDGDTPKSSCP